MTDSLVAAARRVVHNAYGTRPAHTQSAICFPCSLIELAAAVAADDRAAGRDEDRMLAVVAVELAPPKARTR